MMKKRIIAGCATLLMVCLLFAVVAKDYIPETTPAVTIEEKMIEETLTEGGVSSRLSAIVGDAKASSDELYATLVAENTSASIKDMPVAEVTGEETQVPAEWQDRVMVGSNVEKYLRVREEASTDSPVVGKLYRGAVADILERGEEWTKISSGSVEGYVFNEYLAFGLDAQEIAQQEGTWTVTSTEGGLRVRKEPSTDSAIITTLSEGQELHKDVDAEPVDGWVAVVYKKNTYYVSADYVTVELDLGEAISIEEEQAVIAAAAKADRQATLSQGAAIAANYDDLTLLAALIWCEAGNQGDEGRLAVGAVVVNRVRSGAYPNTISDVIYQSGQFGPASNGALARCLANGTYSSACVSAAEQALSGVTNVGGALHFQHVSCGKSGIVIGAHVFY